MDIDKTIDLYKKRESQRYQNMMDFYYGDRNFLVVQSEFSDIWFL